MTVRKETMEKVTITPGRAEQMLATIDLGTYRWKKNNFNRLLSDMYRDRFDSEASIPLVIDYEGRMYNGRHRLAAQMAAGKTYRYWLHVCSPALARRIQTLGDAPSAWGVADELRSHGEINTFVLSSSLSYLHRFVITGGIRGKQTPTAARALELLDANKGLREWLVTPSTLAQRWKISRAMCAALAHTTERHGVPEEDIREFWTTMQLMSSPDPIKVAEAVARPGSGPIATFANWLRQSEPAKGQALRRSEAVVWAFLIKTWNAWITGTKLTSRSLRWDPEKDAFPGIANNSGQTLDPGSDEARMLLTSDPAQEPVPAPAEG